MLARVEVCYEGGTTRPFVALLALVKRAAEWTAILPLALGLTLSEVLTYAYSLVTGDFSAASAKSVDLYLSVW